MSKFKKIKKTKKSAALIIALLIISAVAVFAFTLGRAAIGSVSRTSRSSDAMIAQQAAMGGIEWGLLELKNLPCNLDQTCPLSACTLDYSASTCSGVIPSSNRDNANTYADIWGSVTVTDDGAGGTIRTGIVYSIGQFAGVYKGLYADINTSLTPPVVLGDYIGPIP